MFLFYFKTQSELLIFSWQSLQRIDYFVNLFCVISLLTQQKYHVVLMGLELVGRDWGFGWRASWAVHGISAWVHGWCICIDIVRLKHPQIPCTTHAPMQLPCHWRTLQICERVLLFDVSSIIFWLSRHRNKQHWQTVTLHQPIHWGITRLSFIRLPELEPSIYPFLFIQNVYKNRGPKRDLNHQSRGKTFHNSTPEPPRLVSLLLF